MNVVIIVSVFTCILVSSVWARAEVGFSNHNVTGEESYNSQTWQAEEETTTRAGNETIQSMVSKVTNFTAERNDISETSLSEQDNSFRDFIRSVSYTYLNRETLVTNGANGQTSPDITRHRRSCPESSSSSSPLCPAGWQELRDHQLKLHFWYLYECHRCGHGHQRVGLDAHGEPLEAFTSMSAQMLSQRVADWIAAYLQDLTPAERLNSPGYAETLGGRQRALLLDNVFINSLLSSAVANITSNCVYVSASETNYLICRVINGAKAFPASQSGEAPVTNTSVCDEFEREILVVCESDVSWKWKAPATTKNVISSTASASSVDDGSEEPSEDRNVPPPPPPPPTCCSVDDDAADATSQHTSEGAGPVEVCPGDVAVIQCHTDYSGNRTVRCDADTMAIVNINSTCTLSWIEEVNDMILNGSYAGDTIVHEIQTHVVNGSSALTLNDLRALEAEIRAIEDLERKQLLLEIDQVVRVERALSYTEELLGLTSCLLDAVSTWESLKDSEAATVGPSFLASAEGAGFLLAEQVTLNISEGESPVKQFIVNSSDVYMTVTVATRDEAPSLSLHYSPSSSSSAVDLPPGFASDVPDDNSGYLRVVAFFVASKAARRPMPGTRNLIEEGDRREVNSDIASVSIGTPNTQVKFNPDHQVVLLFSHIDREYGPRYRDLYHDRPHDQLPTPVLGSAACVYWDFQNSSWSSDGCSLTSTGSGQSRCSCSHLTMIAIITDVHHYVGTDHTLDVLGSVVMAFSFCSLMLAFVILQASRLASMRVTLTKQLCVSLGLSQLLLMLMLDPTTLQMSQIDCEITGAMLHFIVLSAIFWMLAEGFHLLHVIYGAHEGDVQGGFAVYWCGCYGMSALVVTLTAVTALSEGELDVAYAGPDTEYCWLNTENGFIWAFTGPLATVITINLVCQMLALRSASTLAVYKQKSVTKKMIVWVKGSMSLSALLGVTWVFGLLYMTESHVFAYVFTLLGGLQGVFILVFHCLLNVAVMEAFAKVLPKKVADKLSRIFRTSSKACIVSQREATGRLSPTSTSIHQTRVEKRCKNSTCVNCAYDSTSGDSPSGGNKLQQKVHFEVEHLSGADEVHRSPWQQRMRSSSAASRETQFTELTGSSSRRSSSTSQLSITSLDSVFALAVSKSAFIDADTALSCCARQHKQSD